jgi:putative pyruvate formate lyase activating enzyme
VEESLTEVFLRLAAQEVHSVSLITPTSFIPVIARAIAGARKQGCSLPFVYNTSAYENVDALRLLDGLIDVYLPDIKYFDDTAARKYSNAPGYFAAAARAVLEMNRQVGLCQFDEDGLIRRGLIIRHLVLPGRRHDAMSILDWVAACLPNAFVSLMAQYFPTFDAVRFPEINRRVTTFEYESVVRHFHEIGLTNGFIQDKNAATEELTPDFNAF